MLQQNFEDSQEIHPATPAIRMKMHAVVFGVFHIVLAQLEYGSRLPRISTDADLALTERENHLATRYHVEKFAPDQCARVRRQLT